MANATRSLPISFLFVLMVFAPQGPCQAPVTIEVGNLNAEDGDIWLRGQIESFRREHPDIRVRLATLASPSRGEIPIEDLPDLALNVLGVISDQGYEIAYLVERDLIRPIADFLPDPEVRLEDFIGNSLDAVTYKGRVWGIPFLAASILFLMDQDLLREANIPIPPANWAEVLDYSRRLTRDSDGDGRVDQWGLRLGMRGRHDTHMFYLWWTLALQKGAEILREGRIRLDHPALREAYDYLQVLESSGGAITDNRRLRDVLSDPSVRYAMQIAPTYQIGPAAGTLHYRFIPWPTWGRQVIPDERRHYLVIGKSTPEKEAASWKFVKWIARRDSPHPPQAQFFGISCRTDLLERPDVRSKIDQWARGFEVVHETKGWNVLHGDPVMGRFAALERLEAIITRLFHSELSFEEAMRIAEEECNAILRAAQGVAQPYALYLPDSAPGFVGDTTLEALCSESRDILQALPNHPGAESLLNRVRDLSPESSRAETLAGLILRFRDHPIGLLAFESALAQDKPGPSQRSRCDKVRKDCSGSAVSRLAWDRGLRLLTPEQRNAEVLQGMEAEDSRLRRVALFRRAEDLRVAGKFTEAAVCYLEFWGTHPECVEKLGWDRTLLACIRNAGFPLDSEALIEVGDPALVARILHEAHTSGGQSNHAVLRALTEWCSAVREGSATETLWEKIVSEASDTFSSARPLDFALEAVYRAGLIDLALREKTATHSEGVLRGSYRLESNADKELARGLARAAFRAGVRAGRASSEWRPLAYRCLDCAARVLDRAGDSSTVLSLLERIVEEVPDPKESPGALLRLASLAREQGEFDRALQALARIAERFPDSRQALEALLLKGIWLYGAGRYGEAMEAFTPLSRGGEGNTAPLIELVTLLCEESSHSPDSLAPSLREYANRWRNHSLSRRALHLLAALCVDRLDYSQAKGVLREIEAGSSEENSGSRAHQALNALDTSLPPR